MQRPYDDSHARSCTRPHDWHWLQGVLGHLLFQERMGAQWVAGALAIVAGVACITSAAAKSGTAAAPPPPRQPRAGKRD